MILHRRRCTHMVLALAYPMSQETRILMTGKYGIPDLDPPGIPISNILSYSRHLRFYGSDMSGRATQRQCFIAIRPQKSYNLPRQAPIISKRLPIIFCPWPSCDDHSYLSLLLYNLRSSSNDWIRCPNCETHSWSFWWESKSYCFAGYGKGISGSVTPINSDRRKRA